MIGIRSPVGKENEWLYVPGIPIRSRCAEFGRIALVMRVRDEAHRFAITYHRNRRDKAMTKSALDTLNGCRTGTAQAGC